MKKILTLLLSLCIVMSFFVAPVTTFGAENTTELATSPVQLDLLDYLGATIRNMVETYPNNSLDRGSAVYYADKFATTIHAEAVPKEFTVLFKDVTSEHRYYAQIKAMYDAGIISGYPDGTFRPDEAITARDAARIFLNILGYKEYIAIFGLDKAIKDSDILEGLEGADKITLDQFARMTWNALHAPAMDISEVTSDGKWYELNEDYTGLNMLHGIDARKGVVNGVPGSNLEIPDQSLDANEILIDGEKLIYNVSDRFGVSRNYLGYSVDYYVKENPDSVDEIVFISKSEKNEEFVLKSDDIDSFSDFKYTYWKNNKSKTVSITDSTYIIYNGVAYPMCSDEDMVPTYGTVTLIDNDGKKGYEVAKIDSYEFLVVDNVDVKNDTFYDIDGETKLDLSKCDEYRIVWEGAEYPIERIVRGDFLVIKRVPESSGYYYAEVELRQDERPITKIESFDVAKGTLRGGGIDYTLWTGISADSKAALKNGAVVTLYFSSDGTVVRVESGTAGGMVYGYLIMAVNEVDAFDEKIQFRIVDQKSMVDAYSIGKTLKIDGASYKKFDDIASVLKTAASMYPAPYYNAEFPYAQPIKYELTDEGLLKGIDTIIFNSGVEDEETALRLDAQGQYRIRGQNNTFYHPETFEMAASMTGTTAKIQVPINAKNEEENYSAFTWTDNEILKNNLFFNVDDSIRIADAVYNFEEISSVARVHYTSKVFVVKDKIAELSNEGDMIHKLIGYSGKNEETYTIGEEDCKNIDVGDLIRVELNADKSVKEGRIELVFDASENKFADSSYVSNGGKMFGFDGSTILPYTIGYKALRVMPINTREGLMSVTTSVPSDGDDFNPGQVNKIDNVIVSSANCYKYSNIRGHVSVEPASLSDLSLYSVNPSSPSEMIMIINRNSVDYLYIIEIEE